MNKRIIPILCVSTMFIVSCKRGGESMKGKTTEDLSKVTFDVEFHRGGRNARPENTLYSYLYAIEQGATTIECDMQLLKDGNIIMSHEPLADPNNFRDKNTYEFVPNVDPQYREDIRNMSIDEIRKKYDVAKVNPETSYYKEHGITQKTPEHADIPTIDELFTLVKNCGRKVQINIETKIYRDFSVEPRAKQELTDTEITKFVTLLNQKTIEYGLEDQVILQSFDWKSLVLMKKVNPKFRTSALSSSQPPYWGIDDYLRPNQPGPSPYLAGLDIDDYEDKNPVLAILDLNSKGEKIVDIFSPYSLELTKDQVELAHKNDIAVIPWTCNDINEINRMYDMGVDGIISDDGELLYNTILSKGETLFSKKPMKDSPYHIS